MGFSVQHVDRKVVEPLRALLSEHVSDPLALEADIDKLDKR
ncbi:hypothetical protein NOR53_205 [gamma proteobacterium NOR5-3]|nr:hypothetical protein NOR53_205 [gamma proteobacterium NOR5-3]